ncbi:MAG: molybdenum cofactor guanylyltransferase [Hyphomonadaceae bacterium]
MHEEMIFGALLAGGQARRLGGAKAMIEIGGGALCTHAARPLRLGASSLAVVGDAEAARHLGAILLSDPAGSPRGPLAGVCAALAWAQTAGAAWLLLAPCDTPFLPDDLGPRLRERAAQTGASLVSARSGDGVHPLVSLWRSDLEGAVRAALQGGRHPAMHDFIADLGAAYLELAQTDLINVNTPQDVEEARRQFARRG